MIARVYAGSETNKCKNIRSLKFWSVGKTFVSKYDTGGGICAGSKTKICAKYAQNMRNPKNGVGLGTPYLITHELLLQNMMMFCSGRNAEF